MPKGYATDGINIGQFKKGTRLGSENSSWQGGQIEKICIKCEKLYLVYPYRKNESNYCSRFCANHSIERGEKITLGLRAKGIRPLINGHHPLLGTHRSEQTKEKLRIANLDKKQSVETNKKRSDTFRIKYLNCDTNILDKLRHCLEYKIWRTSIFKRDNFTCIECGQLGGKLCVDHIIPFSYILKKVKFELGEENLFQKCLNYTFLWDTNNGRTMCFECHKKTDTYLSGSRNYKLNNI